MLKRSLCGGVCIAAMTLVMPVAAQADQPGGGWYVSMFGGVSLPETVKSNFLYSTTLAYSSKKNLKDGFIVGLAAGTNVFMENLRGEVEFTFSSHDGKNMTNTGPTGSVFNYGLNGDLDSYAILANLWYDIDTGTAITPFLGGGVGIGIVDSNLRTTNGVPGVFNDTDVGFAFQVGAGLKYDVTPNISLDVSYRFRGIVDVDIKQTNGVGAPGWGNLKGLDLYTHNVTAGFTYNFDGF